MSTEALDLVARALAWPVGIGILVNGAEELAFDLRYLARGLGRRERRAVSLEALRAAPPRRIAVMLPAWREADVIERMLTHNLGTLDYDPRRYDVFCGTYPNDPDTQRGVEAVARRAHNVHKVVLPHGGPTSKADCLNWIWRGLIAEEARRGTRYDIVVLQDAEDVIHPLALRLFALLVPPHDFVQIPVFSLPLPRRALVGGTYVDEFAEQHLKELVVRDDLGGFVPSAGVGSAFARPVLDEIAGQEGPFDPASLTEDYEIALRLRLKGKRTHFACRSLLRTLEKPRRLLPGKRTVVEEEIIATREYFPDRLAASVRQRSRWIAGITLQAWRSLGWRGPAAVRYSLWRDRKALATNALLLLAYALCGYVGTRMTLDAVGAAAWDLDRLAPSGSALAWLLAANLALLGWRLGMKLATVRRIYGLAHGLLSGPRLVVANLIGLCATGRAVATWVHHRVTGRPLRWVKTTHAFPAADVLRAERRRLGEFLVAGERLSPRDLADALALQQGTDLRLGEVLAACGLLRGADLARALGAQLDLPAIDPDAALVPASLLARLPEEEAEALGALPLAVLADGRARVAFAAAPTTEAVARIAALLGADVAPALAAPRALARARRRAYRLLARGLAGKPRVRLGEALVRRGQLDAAALPHLLEEQAETDEPLGELLVRRRLVSPDAVGAALPDGARPFRSVRPDDVALPALRRLGYGRCAFHGVVPVEQRGGTIGVAAPWPLAPATLARVEAILGLEVRPFLAPGLEVTLALAVASRRAWRGPAAAGLDGAELVALGAAPVDRGELDALAAQARAAGLSPIDLLEAAGRLDRATAAAARARALGLELTPPADAPAEAPQALLPPSLRARGVHVIARGSDAIGLAARRPTPALAREVAALFPDCPVEWTVEA